MTSGLVLASGELPKVFAACEGVKFQGSVFQERTPTTCSTSEGNLLQEPTKRSPVIRLCWIGPLMRSNPMPLPQIACKG